jgi:hypothetical protein
LSKIKNETEWLDSSSDARDCTTSDATIFISHNLADKNLVRELAMRITTHGGSPWVDERQLKLGSDLTAELDEAIRRSRLFVYVASDDSISSEWMRRELSVAERFIRDKSRIIMLKAPGAAPDAIPQEYRDRIFIDLGNIGLDDAAREIAGTSEQSSPVGCDAYVRLAGGHLDHSLREIMNRGQSVASVHFLRPDYSRLDLAYSTRDIDLATYRSSGSSEVQEAARQFSVMTGQVMKCLRVSEEACKNMVGQRLDATDEEEFRWSLLEQSVLVMLDYCDWASSYAEQFRKGGSGKLRSRLPEPFDGTRFDFMFENKELTYLTGNAPGYVEPKFLLPFNGEHSQAYGEFMADDLGRVLGYGYAYRVINGKATHVSPPALREVRAGIH